LLFGAASFSRKTLSRATFCITTDTQQNSEALNDIDYENKGSKNVVLLSVVMPNVVAPFLSKMV